MHAPYVMPAAKTPTAAPTPAPARPPINPPRRPPWTPPATIEPPKVPAVTGPHPAPLTISISRAVNWCIRIPSHCLLKIYDGSQRIQRCYSPPLRDLPEIVTLQLFVIV